MEIFYPEIQKMKRVEARKNLLRPMREQEV